MFAAGSLGHVFHPLDVGVVAERDRVNLDVLRGSSGMYWSSFDDVIVYYVFVPPAAVVASAGSTSWSTRSRSPRAKN